MSNDGSETADDEEDEPWTEVVRAKWVMDGAKTLSEAAEKLRAEAAWLESLEQDGWQLIEKIDDDYGFITNADPAKRLSAVYQPEAPAQPDGPTAS